LAQSAKTILSTTFTIGTCQQLVEKYSVNFVQMTRGGIAN